MLIITTKRRGSWWCVQICVDTSSSISAQSLYCNLVYVSWCVSLSLLSYSSARPFCSSCLDFRSSYLHCLVLFIAFFCSSSSSDALSCWSWVRYLLSAGRDISPPTHQKVRLHPSTFFFVFFLVKLSFLVSNRSIITLHPHTNERKQKGMIELRVRYCCVRCPSEVTRVMFISHTLDGGGMIDSPWHIWWWIVGIQIKDVISASAWHWYSASVVFSWWDLPGVCRRLWLRSRQDLWLWIAQEGWRHHARPHAHVPILTVLGLFVATEGSLEAQGMIARCVWWNTLTSKNGSCAPFQKPLAMMSRRAPSSLLAVRWLRFRQIMAVGAVRWQHCGTLRSNAVMSRISLCQMVGKLPVWQTMAWSMVNATPQLSLVQKETMFGEWESCKPWEEPFSTARSTQCFSCGVSWAWMSFACWSWCCRFSLRMESFRLWLRSGSAAWLISCVTIRAASGAVRRWDT